MYFNTKYKRTGGLYEGPFRATHVDNDEYLKYLFSYIHLNPVKLIDPEWKENGIADRDSAKEYLLKYQYSSYSEYLGILRKEWKILNRVAFPEYFADQRDFGDFIDDWLTFKPNT
jgi:putative transposase